MQIFGPATVQNARAIAESMKTCAAQPSINASKIDTIDQLSISREAQLLMQVQGAPEIRSERVAEIRSQIEAGRYETGDKLNTAVDRLLDELA
jgi:anti-sigma28 factor (negative regulator of flagellin synthesis)